MVVPVFNEGEALAPWLKTLQAWRSRGIALLVVDGGSTDGSLATVTPLVDQLVSAPLGRATQMNAGTQALRADAYLFLHADTQAPEDAPELVLRALEHGAQWGRFDIKVDGQGWRYQLLSGLMNLRSRLTGISTGDQAIFASRGFFQAMHGFPVQALMEDIEWSKRARRISSPACLVAKVSTSARRWQKNGWLRTVFLMWRLRLAYFFGASAQDLALLYGYRITQTPSFVTAIFAKAPLAGYAKTRLIPILGARKAARLARALFLQALERTFALSSCGQQAVALWCAPQVHHRFFGAVNRHYRSQLKLYEQGEGDIGTRMARAAHQHLVVDEQARVLIVGTDAPALSDAQLEHAAQALLHVAVVFIPALDGGYVLIGLSRYIPEIFENISWSTDQVMTQSRERLRSLGIKWIELAPTWDLDEPSDLERLAALRKANDDIAQRFALLD